MPRSTKSRKWPTEADLVDAYLAHLGDGIDTRADFDKFAPHRHKYISRYWPNHPSLPPANTQ